MVLHHVPKGADAIVVVDPIAHAQIFGHGDLHVVDDFPAPEGFEEGVAEAQRQQVLHRFLPQVMINAVDLVLFEARADLIINASGGGLIVAHGLFEHDAHVPGDQPARLEALGNRAEEMGRGRQIDGSEPILETRELFAQGIPASAVFGVEG